MDAMKAMTMKQHATVQMILRGASNQEIADRFGVSVNTAKVYLRSIAKKLGVQMRTQIAVKLLPVMQGMGEADYREVSKGLPKDWDETYAFERREDDPYWKLYTGSRVGANGNDEEDEDGA
jgi:DNA-binding CsgD family transcriptional regulator